MRSLLTRYLTYLFIFFSLPVMGQDYEVGLRKWGMKDGMSDRQVNCVFKDSHGFIWLCTRNGLNSFDGYSFKVYTKEKNDLPFHHLGWMVEDADGLFWIIGSGNECNNDLFIFDPLSKKVTSWKDKTGYKQDETFHFLHKLNDSTLFFGSMYGNYFFTWQPRRGLRKVDYPFRVVHMITISDHNTLWLQDSCNMACEVSLDGKLLNKTKMDTSRHLSSTYSFMGVHKMMRGQMNTYKTLADVHVKNGLAQVTDNFDFLSEDGFNVGVDSIRYVNGSLYSGSKKVLRDFVAEGEVDLASPTIQVLIDKGKIWIANAFGFAQLTITKDKFRKYFYQNPKTYKRNSFRNLLIDNDRLYAVKENSGIIAAEIDSNVNSHIAACPETKGMHYAFTKTWDGILAGTTLDANLYSIHKGSDKWEFNELKKEGKPYPIWKIYQVSPDSFLLGSNAGLKWLSYAKMELTPFAQYNGYDELRKALVLDVIPDRSGVRWICANSGFYQYDPKRGIVARYSPDDTGAHYLPSKDIQHFYQDAWGIYWIATANGLIRWDKAHGTHRLYSREDGLSNSNVYAVYEDHKGRLWLSSDFGIMQFNKTTGKVKTYLMEDGITDNEFNRVSHTRDSAGNIYFGSLNGVTSFNPDNFQDNDDDGRTAVLSLSSLVQFNGSTNQLEDRTAELVHTNTITLKPGDRFFNLSFSLLTFNDVIHTTYYWKIDGIDTAWNNMREPSLRVSGLPYGKRMLHIKAQGYDGRWGKNELLFEINVIRPLYLRIWFIVLCAISLAIGILAIFRWRTFLLKKENERLDSIVKEKTLALEDTIDKLRISSKQKDILMKEIHHRVKNNLQVISTLLDLQLTKIDDEVARKSIEESISRVSSIALVHYHLYKADQLTAIEMSHFAKELFEQVSSVYHQREQAVHLICNIPETNLDIDTALPLGLILNELMTNSFKYAFADCIDCKIDITLTHTGGTFTLQYCDFGPGLPEDYDMHKAESLGMTIIKSLSKQLGGDYLYKKEGNCFVIHFLDAATRKSFA